MSVAFPRLHGPEDSPGIAQSAAAVRLLAVGRVFSTDAVMLMASWLGIVVELTEMRSFRPKEDDELVDVVVEAVVTWLVALLVNGSGAPDLLR